MTIIRTARKAFCERWKIERATLISRINNSDRNRVSVPPLVRCVRNRILGLHSHTHVPTRVYLTVISCGACAFTIAHPCTSISACAHARAHAHVYDFVSRVRTRLVRMRSSAVRSHVSLCAYARICGHPLLARSSSVTNNDKSGKLLSFLCAMSSTRSMHAKRAAHTACSKTFEDTGSDYWQQRCIFEFRAHNNFPPPLTYTKTLRLSVWHTTYRTSRQRLRSGSALSALLHQSILVSRLINDKDRMTQ